MKKSSIFPLVWASPLIATVAGYYTYFDFGFNRWFDTYFQMVMVHAVLFLPLLAGIFSAALCRYEHQSGGWKQLLSLPVKRTEVYISKFLIVMLCLALTQLLFLGGLGLIGILHGFTDPFPYELILTRVFMGWIACLPLVTLQLWASLAWKSFAAPLALNVILTLPNIIVANSEKYGPWYPWSQPFLGMVMGESGDFFYSTETLIFVVVGGFLVFTIGGLTYFKYKAI